MKHSIHAIRKSPGIMVVDLKKTHKMEYAPPLRVAQPAYAVPAVPTTHTVPKKIHYRAIIIGFALVFCAVLFAFSYSQNAHTQGWNGPDAREIVAKVGALIVLPQGEEPVMATVSDVNLLKDQLFFKNAQNGDIVLMYGGARRAILYSPRENKVVEVAPILDTAE